MPSQLIGNNADSSLQTETIQNHTSVRLGKFKRGTTIYNALGQSCRNKFLICTLERVAHNAYF